MAKNTKAVTNRELENTLKVGDNTYNINAVHATEAGSADTATWAESADKVDNSLTLESYGTGGKTTNYYNGSADKTISYVPASGGTFSGPVSVTGNFTAKNILVTDVGASENSLINRKVLEALLKKLSGHPLFNWNGSILEGQKDGDAYQTVSLITGNTENYSKFIESQYSTDCAPYLFICTDGNCNIYLKVKGANPIKLSSLNDVASNIELQSLVQQVGNIKKSLTAYNTRIGTNEAGIKEINNSIDIILEDYNNQDGSDSGTYFQQLTEKVSDVINGNTAVGKATNATNDSDGKAINTNYYRSASNTSAVNKITISKAEPSGAVNGDIWIKYS